jgi:hypothetical protein
MEAGLTEPVMVGRVDLEALKLHELRKLWLEIFGYDAPKAGRAYFTLGIAHRRQELLHRGIGDRGEAADQGVGGSFYR